MNMVKLFGTTLLSFAFLLSSVPVAEAKGFAVSTTAADLAASYQSGKTRVLIVPGHEPQYGGAVYGGVYEREIAVEIAEKLAAELRSDPKLEVIVARDNTAWNPTLAKYFKKDMKKIKKYVSTQKKSMKRLVRKKEVKETTTDTQVEHSTVPSDVALRLYGINKWANENDIDLVVNLHINDAPDHGPTTPGANSGFAVYIPDHQYGNGAASRPVASAIAARLDDLSAKSTLRIENQGVVEDQQLIAIGAYNTLKAPTVLIEYGYITEQRFQRPELRSLLTTDYAYQTSRGIRDFLGASSVGKYATKTLPHQWSVSPAMGEASAHVFALQAALSVLGFYPPSESTLVECPVDGVMDECTQVALKAYQASKKLEQTGVLDAPTRALLNARFGS